MYVGGQGVNIAHFQEGENEEFFSKEELLCVFFSREDVHFYSRPSDLQEERLTNWEVWETVSSTFRPMIGNRVSELK